MIINSHYPWEENFYNIHVKPNDAQNLKCRINGNS